MRILQVRLKNLNSLAGEWSIDLADPAYAGDGIFAITGPTGAGKSTLLDAVCLALYGRTPRLPRIGKSGNEVMSRRTGECFAEVTFETPAGRFRCHWSQHRARRKPDGELQPPRHEIANADSGEIFQSKLRGVAEQIEQATGMDFERFTRSMLLAQGGFAAFLQAAPDERSPLLEQITGTELYSRISVQVHERRAQERKALELLQAGMAGLVPMPEDERAQLALELQAQQQQSEAVARTLKQQAADIAWHENLARLGNEQQALEQQQEQLQAALAAFLPERARLQQAQRALELGGEHAALQALRQQHVAQRTARADAERQWPPLAGALAEAGQVLQAAEAGLVEAGRAQRAAEPLLRQVRELDLKLAEQAAPLADWQAEQERQQRLVADLQQALQQARGRELDNASALRALDEQLADSAADAGLVESLAALRERLDAVGQRQREVGDLRQRQQQQGQAGQQAAALAQQRQAALEQAGEAVQGLQAQLRELRERRDHLLAGDTPPGLRRALESLRGQATRLLQLAELLAQRQAAIDAAAAAGARQQRIADKRQRLAQALETLQQRRQAVAAECEQLQTQSLLLQRIEQLEQARQHLVDGEPCPLCGAREHPYARGQLPRQEQTRQQLQERQRQLAQIVDSLEQARADAAGLRVNAETADEELARALEQRALAQAAIVATCAQLPPPWNLPDEVDADGLQRSLQQAMVVQAQAERALQQRLEQIDGLAETASALQRRLELGQHDQRGLEQAHHLAIQAQQAAQAQATELSLQLQGRVQDLAQLQQQLRDTFAGHAVAAADGHDGFEHAFGLLRQRSRAWLRREEQRRRLGSEQALLQQQLRQLATQCEQAGQHLQARQAQLKQRQGELLQLRVQRATLFGERSADGEQQRLAAALEQANLARQQAGSGHQQAVQAEATLRETLAHLAQALAEREPRLQADEAGFLDQLQRTGFGDEAGYRRALLPAAERAALAERDQHLQRQQSLLARQRQDLAAQLAQLRQAAPEATDLPGLRQAQAVAEQQQRHLLQHIGALGQRLDDDQQLRLRQHEQLQAIQAHRHECLRWDQLHELIGSADGRKYRNFVQGLTFETMVGHANRQLRAMSDRYLLVRDAQQPLELNVIDNYQAGEVRSTKNLSGGESFIVSLALALGLSRMASRNVRVDSLFLDEGFGTLDEDALEVALDTLGSLQQEGKLIGVISHVQALKERIATQIQVTPLAGGRSRLDGPGCRQGEEG